MWRYRQQLILDLIVNIECAHEVVNGLLRHLLVGAGELLECLIRIGISLTTAANAGIGKILVEADGLIGVDMLLLILNTFLQTVFGIGIVSGIVLTIATLIVSALLVAATLLVTTLLTGLVAATLLVTTLLAVAHIIVVTRTVGTLSASRLKTCPETLGAESALIVIVSFAGISALSVNARTHHALTATIVLRIVP